MRDGVGTGRGGAVGLQSLNPSPPRPAPWCGAKILPHPHPTTFAGWEKPTRDETGRGGLSGVGKNYHP